MTYEEADEQLDLVNVDDSVVGAIMREEYHANAQSYVAKGLYFRGTACFLVNSKKEIWVPKRQPGRKIAPNSFDFAMAEHVQSGESHEQAAVRGMHEELNMSISPEGMHLLGKKTFDSFGCVMSVFVYFTENSPDYSRADYQSAQWMLSSELKQQIGDGALHKTALPYWLEKLKEFLNHSDDE